MRTELSRFDGLQRQVWAASLEQQNRPQNGNSSLKDPEDSIRAEISAKISGSVTGLRPNLGTALQAILKNAREPLRT
jgi:hypothetical protein